jgi:hypothetical protein
MMPTKGAGMLSAGQAPPAWCGASIFNFYFWTEGNRRPPKPTLSAGSPTCCARHASARQFLAFHPFLRIFIRISFLLYDLPEQQGEGDGQLELVAGPW